MLTEVYCTYRYFFAIPGIAYFIERMVRAWRGSRPTTLIRVRCCYCFFSCCYFVVFVCTVLLSGVFLCCVLCFRFILVSRLSFEFLSDLALHVFICVCLSVCAQTRYLSSNVISLEMSKRFEYKPGQYVFLNCPYLSQNEWHPFTVRRDRVLSFVCMSVCNCELILFGYSRMCSLLCCCSMRFFLFLVFRSSLNRLHRRPIKTF